MNCFSKKLMLTADHVAAAATASPSERVIALFSADLPPPSPAPPCPHTPVLAWFIPVQLIPSHLCSALAGAPSRGRRPLTFTFPLALHLSSRPFLFPQQEPRSPAPGLSLSQQVRPPIKLGLQIRLFIWKSFFNMPCENALSGTPDDGIAACIAAAHLLPHIIPLACKAYGRFPSSASLSCGILASASY